MSVFLPFQYSTISCPQCNCEAEHDIWSAGKTSGAFPWTDLMPEGPMFRRPLEVVKCRRCSNYYWVKDAVRKYAPQPPWGRSLWPDSSTKEPSETGYYEAIKAGLGKTHVETLTLRKLAWWRRNDGFRVEKPSPGGLQTTPECQENLEALFGLLDEADEPQRLMKAEVARHLERFDVAKRLLTLQCSPEYRHLVRVISDLCDQHCAKVSIVRGDEAFTVEEKELAVQQRIAEAMRVEERRRRLEAEYVEERKVTEERDQQVIQEGKRCPKCGFEYAWDGVACGHCHHKLCPEEIGPKQLEQAARAAERLAPERAEREMAAREQKEAEQARIAQAIKEGKLCPKCEFSYKWDGVRCGHCNYHSPGK